MNNLNIPIKRNIQPNEDGGNGSKWNYALLVPLLGLAAFRWIWSKESEKQIGEAKLEYQEKANDVEKVVETKYQDTILQNRRTLSHLQTELGNEKKRTLCYQEIILENRRTVAHLQTELEKEKKRTLSYQDTIGENRRTVSHLQTELGNEKKRTLSYQDIIIENRRTVAHLQTELEKEKKRTQVLISQSQKLVEERKLLEHELDNLKEEMKAVQKNAALYSSYLEKEEQWRTKAKYLLNEFEEALKERQNIYCSFVASQKKRIEIEQNLLIKASTNPVAVELGMTEGLVDIFKHDTHCAELMNNNKYKNGKLMWLYLKYWELLVDFKKFKRAEGAMIGK